MDLPAELHRWVQDADQPCRSDLLVAKGPLVIIARGLLAIDPAERGNFWISSAMGDLDAGEAEETVRLWERGCCCPVSRVARPGPPGSW